MLSTFKSVIRFSLRPVLSWIWRRIEVRVRSLVEARFRSLEERSSAIEERSNSLESKTAQLQGRITELQARIELLEKDWQRHVPTFLRATSAVVSFERELNTLKDVVSAIEKTRPQAGSNRTFDEPGASKES